MISCREKNNSLRAHLVSLLARIYCRSFPMKLRVKVFITKIQTHLQITRLEETWTTLRRNYTETAISYEKTLKPFYKNLYEGTGTKTQARFSPI